MIVGEANSFHFAGTDMWDTDYQCVIIDDSDFPITPPMRLNTEVLTGAHGNVTQGSKLQAFDVTFQCACLASSPSDLVTRLNNIATVLDLSLKGDQDFILGRTPTKQWQARCTSGLILTRRGMNGAQFNLTFHFPDPIPITITP